MNSTILLTGSAGLIGAALARRLEATGATILPVDLRTPGPESAADLCNHDQMSRLAGRVDGIVHLGGVSRVVDGQNDPARCRAVNVDATRNLLSATLESKRRPWFIYASSREVYGQQDSFPVSEDAEFRPLNVYARSKVEAEGLCNDARAAGARTAIVRFSSVYGSADDHRSRVVPAFLRAALAGGVLRVEGAAHTFDLTHIDDVVDGLSPLIDLMVAGEREMPAIHFTSGVGVSLLDLAKRAIALGNDRATIALAEPRSYDISHFVGSPARASQLLGWQASTPLQSGLKRLADDLAATIASPADAL